MKTRHTYHSNMKRHITFFVFMMLLISIIFFKKVTAQAVHTSNQNHLSQSQSSIDLKNATHPIL